MYKTVFLVALMTAGSLFSGDASITKAQNACSGSFGQEVSVGHVVSETKAEVIAREIRGLLKAIKAGALDVKNELLPSSPLSELQKSVLAICMILNGIMTGVFTDRPCVQSFKSHLKLNLTSAVFMYGGMQLYNYLCGDDEILAIPCQ